MNKNYLKSFFKQVHVLHSLANIDIRQQYAGSVLGLFWVLIQPCILVFAYYFVYTHLFSRNIIGTSSLEYIFILLAGLLPFLSFSSAVSTSAVSITANLSLIKNCSFDIILIPIKSVLVSYVTYTLAFIFLIFASLIFNLGSLSPNILLIFVAYIFQMIFNIGLALILSPLSIFFKDIVNFIQPLLLLLMLISPIAYRASSIGNKMAINTYNPLSWFISFYQDLLVYNNVLYINLMKLACLSSLVLLFGIYLFNNFKKALLDHV